MELQELVSVSTHPFLDAACLAQGPLRGRDAVRDTAVAFAEAPELSTHFLGKKATASWSGVIVSASRLLGNPSWFSPARENEQHGKSKQEKVPI